MSTKPTPSREQLLAFLKTNTVKIEAYERELAHAANRNDRGTFRNREFYVSMASRQEAGMTDDTRQHAFWLLAHDLPALQFGINIDGKLFDDGSRCWETDAEGYEDLAADRKLKADERQALYFDDAGYLDLEKVLKYQILTSLAYEEASAREDKHSDNKQLSNDADHKHNVAWRFDLAVCLATAKSLSALCAKADIVAKFCDPSEGETGYEKSILESLASDIHNISNMKEAA